MPWVLRYETISELRSLALVLIPLPCRVELRFAVTTVLSLGLSEIPYGKLEIADAGCPPPPLHSVPVGAKKTPANSPLPSPRTPIFKLLSFYGLLELSIFDSSSRLQERTVIALIKKKIFFMDNFFLVNNVTIEIFLKQY